MASDSDLPPLLSQRIALQPNLAQGLNIDRADLDRLIGCEQEIVALLARLEAEGAPPDQIAPTRELVLAAAALEARLGLAA